MPVIHGEASFQLATPELELTVTARGGHLAPVVFHLPGRDVAPYALAPWQPAEFSHLPPLLSVLRGDFFCFPFGGQVDGPPHGESANGEWSLDHADARSLHLSQQPGLAHFEKILSAREGQAAIYSEHRISKLEGRFNYGNHPVLDLSGLPEATGRISTSPFHWASVFPGPFANPEAGERQALAEGTTFTDLRAVKLAAGGTADLTRYPQRAGHEDLVMMANVAATPEQPFAWSAAVLDGYLWFSLKNPRDFPATLLWMSNGGRSSPPWNGRHCGRIGIEEVCSHFSDGLDRSRQDLLAAHGIATTRHFTKDQTVSLRIIQSVALIPDGFGAVIQIVPEDDDHIRIVGESGATLNLPIDWSFIA